MPWVIPAIAAAVQVAGGVAGNEAGRGDREAAERERNAAIAAIQNLQIPDMEKQKLLLELPQIMGQIVPQHEQYFQQDPSAMEGISVDPVLQQAQMAALQSLQTIGDEGMTASERAVLNSIRRDTAQQDQARQQSILANMQERGIGGSGIELAARLSSSQAAADRASQESDRLAAMAQQRALESIQAAGNMGGAMRTQEFGEKSNVARAKDAINQFNTANKQSVESRNVGAEREAQIRNLQEKQRISEAQTGLRNNEQQYNKELANKQYAMELQKAQAISNAKNGLANSLTDQANQAGQMWSQIGAGAGQAIIGGGKALK